MGGRGDDVIVRVARDEDRDGILAVHRSAFGRDDEAELVAKLLGDPTAQPVISIIAEEGGRIVGHVLFSAARVSDTPVRATLLAPLAVSPEAQGRGVGVAVTREAIAEAEVQGFELVFVLGDPGYYTRFGFTPAGEKGLHAPHPVPLEHAEAWMVRGLGGHVPGSEAGTLAAADAIMPAEYWRE